VGREIVHIEDQRRPGDENNIAGQRHCLAGHGDPVLLFGRPRLSHALLAVSR
jgi:hypothetical protein